MDATAKRTIITQSDKNNIFVPKSNIDLYKSVNISPSFNSNSFVINETESAVINVTQTNQNVQPKNKGSSK